jgi:hypothetical protein
MTFGQAVELLPLWVRVWLWIFVFGAGVLPLVLLVWQQSRKAAVVTLLADVAAGISVSWLFGQLGYVKLLGLPHLIFWTPLVWFLLREVRRADMPLWPRRILWAVIAAFVVSLAFDYVDVARYVLGERAALGSA